MDEKQLKALTESLKSTVGELIDEKLSSVQSATASPQATATTPPTEQVIQPTTTEGEPITREAVMEAMKAVLDSQSSEGENRAFEVMFNNQLDTVKANNPGLEEYLESTDDYDEKRIDKIMDGNYEERTARLKSVANSFAQAQTSESGRPPVVSEKVRKRVEETEAGYDAIDKKIASGGYTTLNEMANDFFNNLDIEMAGLE